MKSINQMKLQFDSRSSNESFARMAISSFILALDPTIDELSDIKTAISEAVTNCIVHGYKDKISTIYITANIYEDRRLVVRVKDKGCGISNIEAAMEPLFTSCTSGERAGLGFAVMESLMDKIKVISKEGKGTTVTLTRRITSKGVVNE